jgi:fatty acid desaturase
MRAREAGWFRCSPRDAWLVAAAFVQSALLLVAARECRSLMSAMPAAVMVALSLWWGSNTVSHNHLHNPLFRARFANRAFSLYLTALLGVPQSVWRARHLWHHAGERGRRPRAGREAVAEIALVAAVMLALVAAAPRFFLLAYAPGYLAGMLLCRLQGHFEHVGVGERGISCYGALYNAIWFNDGYHVEHHRHPGEHWTRLPGRRLLRTPTSQLPPVLRFLPLLLHAFERLALAWRPLERAMVAVHERAFRRLAPAIGAPRRVCVVGGGLFPRTALALRRVWPEVEVEILDASQESLDRARRFLADNGHSLARVRFRLRRFGADTPCDADLVVVPLAFVGDRGALYGRPGIVVHDWIWRRRGRAGVVVAPWLLKRLNLA